MANHLKQPANANHEASAEHRADLSLIQALRMELERSAAAQADAVDDARNLAALEINTFLTGLNPK